MKVFESSVVAMIVACSVSILAIGGCRTQLADQREIELGTGDIKSVSVDPVGTEKIIKVNGTAEGGPIHVHVFRFADEEEVERAITLGVASEKINAQQTDTNKFSLEATIPANQEAIIRFATAKTEPANVWVTISE